MVMKIVDTELEKADFLIHLEREIVEFCSHVARVKRQYVEIQTLKANLNNNEVIIHMDFATYVKPWKKFSLHIGLRRVLPYTL